MGPCGKVKIMMMMVKVMEMMRMVGMIVTVAWPRWCGGKDRGAHDGDGGINGRRLLRRSGWVGVVGSLDEREKVLAAIRRRRRQVTSTAVHGGVSRRRGCLWVLELSEGIWLRKLEQKLVLCCCERKKLRREVWNVTLYKK